MRQGWLIGGAVVAIGLVTWAVIASSTGSGTETATKAERKRVAASASDTDGDPDAPREGKRARERDAKRPAVRGPAPLNKPAPVEVDEPETYAEGRDEFDKLLERVEDMAEKGEHLTREEWVDTYRRGDILMVAMMRTPEVGGSEVVRSDLSKLNQRFRMAINKVTPIVQTE